MKMNKKIVSLFSLTAVLAFALIAANCNGTDPDPDPDTKKAIHAVIPANDTIKVTTALEKLLEVNKYTQKHANAAAAADKLPETMEHYITTLVVTPKAGINLLDLFIATDAIGVDTPVLTAVAPNAFYSSQAAITDNTELIAAIANLKDDIEATGTKFTKSENADKTATYFPAAILQGGAVMGATADNLQAGLPKSALLNLDAKATGEFPKNNKVGLGTADGPYYALVSIDKKMVEWVNIVYLPSVNSATLNSLDKATVEKIFEGHIGNADDGTAEAPAAGSGIMTIDYKLGTNDAGTVIDGTTINTVKPFGLKLKDAAAFSAYFMFATLDSDGKVRTFNDQLTADPFATFVPGTEDAQPSLGYTFSTHGFVPNLFRAEVSEDTLDLWKGGAAALPNLGGTATTPLTARILLKGIHATPIADETVGVALALDKTEASIKDLGGADSPATSLVVAQVLMNKEAGVSKLTGDLISGIPFQATITK